MWMGTPHCFMGVSREREREKNNQCFEDIERTIPDLQLSFL